MGTLSFQLPKGPSTDALRELERACMAGGPDNMPWPTDVQLGPDQLTLRRTVDESGYLVAPWDIAGFGRVMGTSATLMERPAPYYLQVELARGKINQLRGQAADWRAGGLQVPSALGQQIRDASLAFGRAVTQNAPDQAGPQAQAALVAGYRSAQQLVQTYMEQVFQIRQSRQPTLDTTLGCRLASGVPQGPAAAALVQSCNSVSLPLTWKEVERTEGNLEWGPQDAVLDWAESQGLAVTAGPLLDFSAACLPDWLWLWERDLSNLARYMCGYVEAAVQRYRTRIRRWRLTAASNYATVLGLGEDELLWLTVRLAEAARQVDPDLDLVTGISQPWGEYMAVEDRIHSPFIFADTLVRAGLNLAALDLEVVMGVTPRGSYCRDLLELSRLFDLYALLGVPLWVTIGYPSGDGPDPLADPELHVGAGHWRDGFSPDMQAEWAMAFAGLSLCKPFVEGVSWVHFSDAEPHQFPNCGLVDAAGNPKPALQRLADLRARHLR